ncbi:MAG: DUF6320 domain-containing protein [Acholeplasmataceae bacterium]
MKYCKNCHIHYDTPLETCMFCNGDLESNGDTVYKFMPVKKHGLFPLFYKLFVFLNLMSLALSVFLDYNANGWPLSWSYLVGSANIYIIILAAIIVAPGAWISKVNKGVLSFWIWITIFSYVLGNYHWAIDYVIPFSISFNILLLTILLTIDRKKWFDYSIGLFFFSVLAFIPTLFNILSVTVVQWPSLAATIYGIITLIGLFFFSSKETKDEFKRRFHI